MAVQELGAAAKMPDVAAAEMGVAAGSATAEMIGVVVVKKGVAVEEGVAAEMGVAARKGTDVEKQPHVIVEHYVSIDRSAAVWMGVAPMRMGVAAQMKVSPLVKRGEVMVDVVEVVLARRDANEMMKTMNKDTVFEGNVLAMEHN